MPSTADLQAILNPRLDVSAEQIENFCCRWKISELALFGSVLRNDFRSDSDVDVLVSFDESEDCWNLFDLIKMKQELEAIFQRKVDLTEKSAIKNPYSRKEILNTYRVIYVN
jgi:uncharacterized protein